MKLLRRSRRFRPALEGTLEHRSLLSFSPGSVLPMDAINDWSNAQSSVPNAIWGWDTSSGSATNTGGGYEITHTWHRSFTDNSSGGVTDMMGDSTDTWTTTSTADIGYSSSFTTTVHGHFVQSVSEDGLVTFSWDYSVTNEGTVSQAATASSNETWTDSSTSTSALTQQGSYFSPDDVWGNYNLTLTGSESHPHTNSVNGGGDSFSSTNTTSWTLNASGGMGPLGAPGPYSMTFNGSNSENDADSGGTDGGFSYAENNTLTVTASGTGVGGSTDNYTLSAGGSVTGNLRVVIKGEGLSGYGWTSTATIDESISVNYSLSDSGGNYTFTNSQSTTGALSAQWNDPTSGPGNLLASETRTDTLSGSSSAPWTLNGVPVFAGFTMKPPTGPSVPAFPVPTIPELTPADCYYNWLTAQYNAGLIVWPYKVEEWKTFADTIGPQPVLPDPVKWTFATFRPMLGRPAGVPSGFTGIMIVPYTWPPPGGFVWQYYWCGWQVNYGLGR